MAAEDNSNPEPDKQPANKRVPTPLQRKRLLKLFEAAAKQDSLNKYDYATDLYADCVRGDPGNLEYVKCLVEVLQKRYVSVKKLGPMVQFKARGEKSALKKAMAQCKWDEALQQGIAVLLANPWDAPTLTQMAVACGKIFGEEGMAAVTTYGDCELYYLKTAFDTAPREKPDVEVCQQLAEALTKRERYTEAINFWHKVEQVRPDDDLPKRSIAALTVLLHQAKDKKFDGDKKPVAGAAGGAKPQELSHEDRLKQRIERNPKDLSGYDELSNLYLNSDSFDKALGVLQQKLEVTNNDVQVQELMEDVQLKALRSQMIKADAKAKSTGKEADVQAFQAIRDELVEKELETYRVRCERYPNNLAFRFELGRRYQLAGRINEAIKELQVAKADPRKRGVCMLYLGDCFYTIKQYQLALTHYETAVTDIPDRDADNKKKAYVKAGRLAMALKDLVKADKYLTTLASMDYQYPGISKYLEQLRQAKEAEAGKEPTEKKPERKKPAEEGEESEQNEE